MKVGIFGGTFNPPHNTHVDIVKQCLVELKLDKVIVFPCGEPPHKFCSVSKDVRKKMTQLAFSSLSNVEIDDFELKKEGASFTVETLEYLKQKSPEDNLFLILGGDSLADFGKWHKPQEIVKLCTLVAVKRAGVLSFEKSLKECEKQFNCKILTVNTHPSNISSTEIRLRVQYGFSPTDVVPNSVLEFIQKDGIYSEFRWLTSRLGDYLDDKRLSHTFFTTLKALELNVNCDINKVFVAATLHDIAKNMTQADFSRFGFSPNDLPKTVVHAHLGALVAKKDFGISDPEILDAIRFHTTARPNMSELEMLIYTADKIEASRPYKTAHLLMPTLEQTFFAVLNEVCQLLKGDNLSSLTQQALEYYKTKKEFNTQA